MAVRAVVGRVEVMAQLDLNVAGRIAAGNVEAGRRIGPADSVAIR